ncbi:uncharacterized protein LOC129221531 [Uloborus diversus]|uniref:uncharacterized protein LOC129221531 n=1 Tax=Uloborus diversus TaxID=327109 RepID=UPI00240A0618|nr:uncharacterized protein LOC129221531 [Uloborus diversus]
MFCNMDALGKSDLEVLSAPTVRCYKHDRNEKLNFMLNVLMVAALVSAFSFGTGHFIGSSHKCRSIDGYLTEPLVIQTPDGLLKHNVLKKLSSEKHSCKQRCLNDIDVTEGVTMETAGYSFAREVVDGEKDMVTLVSNNLLKNSAVVLDKSMNSVFNSLSEKNNVNDSGDTHEAENDEVTQNFMNTVSKITEQQSSDILNLNIMEKFREKIKHVNNKELDLLTNLKQDITVVINSLNLIFGLKSKFSDEDLKAVKNMHKSFEMGLNTKISELEMYVNDPLYEQRPQTFRKQFFSLIQSIDGLLKAHIKSFKKNNVPMNKTRLNNVILKSLDDLERKWKNSQFKSKNFKKKHSEKIEKFPKKKTKQMKKKVFHASDKVKVTHKKNNYLKKYKF